MSESEVGQAGGFKTAAELAREKGLALPGAASPAVANAEDEVIRTLFKSSKDQLTDPEITFVLAEAKRTKLHPIREMAVWRDKHTGKLVLHTKIDGLLALAESTGRYRGTTPTLLTWSVGSGQQEVRPMRQGPPGKEGTYLLAATCGVLVEGYPEPVEVTRFWADFAPKDVIPGSSWDRQPAVMLEKCALAGALRRALPRDLAGLYERAELEREGA